MGRYSPTVLPQSYGPGAFLTGLEGVTEGVYNYLSGREEKKARDRARELEDIRLSQEGIRPTADDPDARKKQVRSAVAEELAPTLAPAVANSFGPVGAAMGALQATQGAVNRAWEKLRPAAPASTLAEAITAPTGPGTTPAAAPPPPATGPTPVQRIEGVRDAAMPPGASGHMAFANALGGGLQDTTAVVAGAGAPPSARPAAPPAGGAPPVTRPPQRPGSAAPDVDPGMTAPTNRFFPQQDVDPGMSPPDLGRFGVQMPPIDPGMYGQSPVEDISDRFRQRPLNFPPLGQHFLASQLNGAPQSAAPAATGQGAPTATATAAAGAAPPQSLSDYLGYEDRPQALRPYQVGHYTVDPMVPYDRARYVARQQAADQRATVLAGQMEDRRRLQAAGVRFTDPTAQQLLEAGFVQDAMRAQQMATQYGQRNKWVQGGSAETGYYLYNQANPDDVRPVNQAGQAVGAGMPKRAADMLLNLDRRYAQRYGNTFNIVRQQTQNTRAGLQLLKSGRLDDNGAARMLTLYGFIRSIDPTSVVREGEVAIFNNAMTWLSKIEQEVNRVGTGNIPKAVMDSFEASITALEQASARRESELREQYARNYTQLTGRGGDEMLNFIPSAFTVRPPVREEDGGGTGGSSYDREFGNP